AGGKDRQELDPTIVQHQGWPASSIFVGAAEEVKKPRSRPGKGSPSKGTQLVFRVGYSENELQLILRSPLLRSVLALHRTQPAPKVNCHRLLSGAHPPQPGVERPVEARPSLANLRPPPSRHRPTHGCSPLRCVWQPP